MRRAKSNKNQLNENRSYDTKKNNNSFNNTFFIVVIIVGLVLGIFTSKREDNPIIPSLLFSATITGLVYQFMGGIESKGLLKLPMGVQVGGNLVVLLGCTVFFREYLDEPINPSDIKSTLGDIENIHEQDIVAVFIDREEKKVLFDNKNDKHPDLVISNNEQEILKISGITPGFFKNNTELIHYDINEDDLQGIDIFRKIDNNQEQKYDLGLLTNRKLEKNYYYYIKNNNLLEGLKRIQKEDKESLILKEIRQECRSYETESFCSGGEKQVALSFTPELNQQRGYEENDGRIGVVCQDSEFNLNQQIRLQTRNSDSLVDIVIVGKNLPNIYCKYDNFNRIQTTEVIQNELGIMNTDSKGFFIALYTPNESNAEIVLPNP